jgi:hypothetical protein
MFAKFLNLITFGWFNNYVYSGLDKLTDMYDKREEDRRKEMRDCRYSEMMMYEGEYVIVITNNWGDPYVGLVTDAVFLGENDASPFLKTKCALTGKEHIHFGKHVLFSYPILKALMSVDPYERWTMMTNQDLLQQDKPDDELTSYEELEKRLLEVIPKV